MKSQHNPKNNAGNYKMAGDWPLLDGVIHLVRTHEGGEGGSSKCVRMRTRGEGGLTHEVRTQSKKLLAFCIHPATSN